MYRNLILLLPFSFLYSCGTDGKETRTSNKLGTSDYNILIVPDLSNRIDANIHPKPIKDEELIGVILDSIPAIQKLGGRSTNQLDIYKLDFINRGILAQTNIRQENLTIDFRNFEGKLNDASEYRRNKLKTDINSFKDNLTAVYKYSLANNAGSDVWTYFNENVKLSELEIKEKKIPLGNSENDSIIKSNKNVVILLTDGYIETGFRNSGYSITQALVNDIRTKFNASGSKDLENFITSNPQFHIKKTEYSLSNLNIFVAEIIDRSLNPHGIALQHPTDFEILQILWANWLKNSGAKNFVIKKAYTNKEQFYIDLKEFLLSIK